MPEREVWIDRSRRRAAEHRRSQCRDVQRHEVSSRVTRSRSSASSATSNNNRPRCSLAIDQNALPKGSLPHAGLRPFRSDEVDLRRRDVLTDQADRIQIIVRQQALCPAESGTPSSRRYAPTYPF